MTRHTVYLSLGSNVGDRAAMLKRAIEALRETGVRVRRRSSLFESQPVDFPAQHWFLNGVVEAETELLPLQLLHALRRIEFGWVAGSFSRVARGGWTWTFSFMATQRFACLNWECRIRECIYGASSSPRSRRWFRR